MQAKRNQLEYVPDPNKFDLVTHRWDSQGKLVQLNLYRKFLIGNRAVYERPVNSGNLWGENNQPAGRVECEFNDKGHIVKKTFDFEAAHKSYTAPLKGAEKVHFEAEQLRDKLAAAEAELAAIKAERDARAAKPVEPAKSSAKVEAKPAPPTLSKQHGG